MFLSFFSTIVHSLYLGFMKKSFHNEKKNSTFPNMCSFGVSCVTYKGIISLRYQQFQCQLFPLFLYRPQRCKRAGSRWLACSKKRWQFPNCLDGLDGKHVKIYPPANSGSLYHNFKGGFSVVLMALLDANLEFIHVDVGQCGGHADGGIWRNCASTREWKKEWPTSHRPGTFREPTLKVPTRSWGTGLSASQKTSSGRTANATWRSGRWCLTIG